MGMWAQYNKAFQPSWLSEATLKTWWQEIPGNKTKAFCRVGLCKAEIRAHKNDLTKYADSVKAQKNMSAIGPWHATTEKSFSRQEKVPHLKFTFHLYCLQFVNTLCRSFD